MRLEERVPREKLHQNTSDAPDITRETPAQVQYNLRCPVVPCGDNRGMVLIIECGRTEINETDLTVEEDTPLAGITRIHTGR